MPKIQVKAVGRLTQAEFSRLRELTFGPVRGQMYKDLESVRSRHPKDGKAVMVREDDGTIVAWALVYPHPYHVGKTDFEVFTEPIHRRKGYGKMVYTKARQLAGGYAKIVVHPHDARSYGFFNSVHH